MRLNFLLSATMLSFALISPAAFAEDAQPAAPAVEPAPVAAKPALVASGGVDLRTAIERALKGSPRIKSAESAAAASQGERTQAGLWSNPEIGVQAENIAGGGRYTGVDSAEITYGVSQVIEIGGKRSGRVAVAEQDMALSRYAQTAEFFAVTHDASVAYANAVAAQEMLALATEQKEVAEGLFKEVRERVDAAREPLIQKSKAQITVSTANFAHERAERELGHTKHVLSNLWGGHDDNFALAKEDFFSLTPPLTEAEAEKRMEQNPNLKRMESSYAKMQAKYELEKSNSIPDPRINLGVRDLRDTGDQAFVAGITIPIPVFNQNQGNIERARHEVSKAETDTQTVKLSMVSALHEALESQINAYRNADNLKTSILPSAEKAFTLSRQGYRAGKFPYLEVLDAQRTLFEVKEQYISALKEYHVAKAEVDRLTANHAANAEPKEGKNAE